MVTDLDPSFVSLIHKFCGDVNLAVLLSPVDVLTSFIFVAGLPILFQLLCSKSISGITV